MSNYIYQKVPPKGHASLAGTSAGSFWYSFSSNFARWTATSPGYWLDWLPQNDLNWCTLRESVKSALHLFHLLWLITQLLTNFQPAI